MERQQREAGQTSAPQARKPSFGETLDELRKRLGRIEKHLIDIKEASRRRKEEAYE